MTERFAIYYAPERGSALDRRAEAWLAQEDLLARTVSARRYGFHATIKAPMALAPGYDRAALEMGLANFARTAAPVDLGRLAVTPIDLEPDAAKELTERLSGVTYEPGRAQLSVRVPKDPVERFPAVVAAADALLAVTAGEPLATAA